METGEGGVSLEESVSRFNHLRHADNLRTLGDWQHECLRQDRMRGEAVTKLNRVREILMREDVGPFSSRELLDEIQEVLDDE